MQKDRIKSNTSIRYVIVSPKSKMTLLLPPSSFNHGVLDFIKKCPADLLELDSNFTHLVNNQTILINNPVDVTVVRSSLLDSYLALSVSDQRISLFFLDKSIEGAVEAFKKINSTDKSNNFYYCFFGENKTSKIKSPRVVKDPIDFVKSLLANTDHYKKTVNKLLRLRPSVPITHKHLIKDPYFVPTHSNTFTLNRISGNLPSVERLEKDKYLEKVKEEIINAAKNGKSFIRQQKFIHQIENRDFFTDKMLNDGLIKRVLPNDPIYSPLILVSPYHNPDLKKFIDPKKAKLLQTEQTENYVNVFETESDIIKVSEEQKIAIHALQIRLLFLDDIAYLHASFNHSPIVRTPVVGKSINRELSFFRVKAFPNISKEHTRKKLRKSIEKFGVKVSKRILAEEVKEIISKRDCQIVAITDLPIEWLNFNGVPLSFSHDVTKIPETFLPGIISVFSHNNNLSYSISKDILSKTLVIVGSDEDTFLYWFNTVLEESESIGFNCELCLTNKEVLTAINKYKPEFLIFDCHGDYNEEKQESFLYIGEEIFDGDFIVKNKISVELVFLSACGTSPTYGTINSIANAFFETGTFAITTTYLPISVDSGTRLYLRVLRNLINASNKPVHKNWLSFISHNIRTSSFLEAYLPLIKDQEERIENLAEILRDSMVFKNRAKLFNNVSERLSTFDTNQRNEYLKVIPEYLFYSNMGRGDLVLFDSWKEEYIQVNEIPDVNSLDSPPQIV